jgi:hypothetical protein
MGWAEGAVLYSAGGIASGPQSSVARTTSRCQATTQDTCCLAVLADAEGIQQVVARDKTCAMHARKFDSGVEHSLSAERDFAITRIDHRLLTRQP